MRRIAPLAALAALALTAALASPVAAYDPKAVAETKHQLQAGVDSADVGEILAARARFQTLATLEPKRAILSYWVAVADWRAVGLLVNGEHPDRDKAKKHCEAGLAAAERALQLDPKFGGALAVKVGLLGLSLSFQDASAVMTIGPQMENDMGRAIGLAGEDPRVHLFDGINTFHKPAFVGGGPKAALGKLRRSIELFAAGAPADAAAADWGRDDALLWAGRAAMKLGDFAAAKDYFARALAANPANGWVRGSLLPQAERALADSGKGRGQ